MSFQVAPSRESGVRPCSVERDVILNAAVAMLQSSQEISRRSLGRRAGVAAATVVKHFKSYADLMAEVSLSGRMP